MQSCLWTTQGQLHCDQEKTLKSQNAVVENFDDDEFGEDKKFNDIRRSAHLERKFVKTVEQCKQVCRANARCIGFTQNPYNNGIDCQTIHSVDRPGWSLAAGYRDVDSYYQSLGGSLYYKKDSSYPGAPIPKPVVAQPQPQPQPVVQQPPATTPWTSIGGILANASITDGYACGTNATNDIFCAPFGTDAWSLKNGKLKQLSIDGTRACGTTSGDDIFCADDFQNPQWQQVPGKLKQVDLSGNIMCGVTRTDDIFCANYKQGNWSMKPGKLSQISVDGQKACGVTSGGSIWCADDVNNAQWQNVPGSLSQVDLSGNRLCGVQGNKVYCSDNKGTWTIKNDNASSISIYGNKAFAVKPSGELMYHNSL